MGELERALAFEEALRDRCVERTVPFAWGRAVITESLPRVWDLNNLRIERADGVAARELAAEADRLLGDAGLAHRRITVLDERAGARLAAEFSSLGWRADRFLYMAHRGSPERDADRASVSEVELADLAELRATIVREEPWGKDEEVVGQLLEAAERVSRAGQARHFAVLVGGEAVAAADLYRDGATAQIEDVGRLPEHRGRGYAAAVVLRARAEAKRAGHDFVFLIADDADWPKKLYARLGFVPIGRKHAFLKAPPPAASGVRSMEQAVTRAASAARAPCRATGGGEAAARTGRRGARSGEARPPS